MNETSVPKGLFKYLWNSDMVAKFQPELEQKYIVNPKTHKIEARGRTSHIESPWVHAKQDETKDCNFYHFIFDNLGFIPRRCMTCWKVVVKPRTIKELFILHRLQKKLGRYSKCGIETRDYTRGLYGGYFYNDSREEGFDCKMIVRQAVDNWISPDVPVILKRYCTEFEIKLGDSAEYKRPDRADEMEDWAYEHIENSEGDSGTQPDFIKKHVMERWIRWAWKFDQSDDVFEFGDPEDFYTVPRAY